MDLSAEQKQSVSRWAQEGASLSDIQKRITSEFNVTLTYMDVRLLVIELGLAVRDKPTAASLDTKAGKSAVDLLEDKAAAGSVSVDVDRVMRPGSLVSGSVRFSDGTTASWMLDQYGRLALDASKKGYKPSAEDLKSFQEELRSLLERQGF